MLLLEPVRLFKFPYFYLVRNLETAILPSVGKVSGWKKKPVWLFGPVRLFNFEQFSSQYAYFDQYAYFGTQSIHVARFYLVHFALA